MLIVGGVILGIIGFVAWFKPSLFQRLPTIKGGIAKAFILAILVGSLLGSALLIGTFFSEGKKSISENIPPTAGWKQQGSGAANLEYSNGTWILNASLNHADDYAELFLDLKNVFLNETEQNIDGSYNLAGTRLIAVVRSDQDFRGDPNHLNGAQILIKNNQFDSWVGP